MMQLRVCRANHNSVRKLKDLIYESWNAPGALYRKTSKCISRNADTIIESFLFVQNRCDRYSYVRFHCIELLFYQEEKSKIINVVELIESFLEKDFQYVVRVDSLQNGCYKVIFVINSVSYSNRGMFSDRNDTYISLTNDLKKIMNIEVLVAEETLFDIDRGYVRNYAEATI